MTSALREAKCTPTDKWNADRRVALLHSAAITMPLLLLRLEQKDPALDGDKLLWEPGQDEHDARTRYFALEKQVTQDLRPRVDAMMEDFRTNRADEAYGKVDAAIDEFVARLNAD